MPTPKQLARIKLVPTPTPIPTAISNELERLRGANAEYHRRVEDLERQVRQLGNLLARVGHVPAAGVERHHIISVDLDGAEAEITLRCTAEGLLALLRDEREDS